MTQDKPNEKEAVGSVPPGHPLGETRKPEPPPGSAGPTAPGSPEPQSDLGPESGSYDNRPSPPTPNNAKGGYGAG